MSPGATSHTTKWDQFRGADGRRLRGHRLAVAVLICVRTGLSVPLLTGFTGFLRLTPALFRGRWDRRSRNRTSWLLRRLLVLQDFSLKMVLPSLFLAFWGIYLLCFDFFP